MEDLYKSLECNDDDVVEFGENTYKIDRLKKAINQSSNSSLAQKLQQELNNQRIQIPSLEKFFKDGIDCQILRLGSQGWKKGKVKFKLSVEFYIEEDVEPEITEPESPLDDLRRKIDEGNS